ncbi:16S rRNA (uracil(1498)-N(3))-methyltransferase [Bermanella sp. 47_1433_sub80_T6]|nr:16S rRNA (uracil(1498)-N(3))-methyltransferase [Bermanella sp. 47_1433_sub80_T6]
MRIPRIYTPQTLSENTAIQLDEAAANHVARVLRMKAERELIVFNGEAQQHFSAQIISVDRKAVSIQVLAKNSTQLESPLHIHLGQAISKGDRFEFAIQKAVELGVNEITPLWTTNCDVKLNSERLEKKIRQWRQIAIAACEQSGRDVVPTIHLPAQLETWLPAVEGDEKWVLDPRGLPQESAEQVSSACILVGPEGGLSEQEVDLACEHQFIAKLIGPRILRTETAALTAVCLMQSLWGDF